MTPICHQYFEDLRKIKPDLDSKLLEKVVQFACMAHEGVFRKSGEPYVVHALETGKILAQWNLDATSIIAGILHDVIDDGVATKADLVKEFGEEVAFLVEGVSRLGTIHLRGSDAQIFVESLRKMFVAMARDLRVVLIKVADRLHNMRTIQFLPAEKQKQIATETLEIFAPLADRLQMGKAKAELEDLAFSVLWPKEFTWVKEISKTQYDKIEVEMENLRRKILGVIGKAGVKKFEVDARKKHWYSLYRKLLRPDVDRQIDLVADFMAFRILVPEVVDCYKIMGDLCEAFTLDSKKKISDFIARPKSNGYQSIHLKILGSKNRPVEIQIRTFAMHEQAEFGVAAHFRYAEIKSTGISSQELERGFVKASSKRFHWVNQLVQWHKETADNREFYEGLTKDFLSDRIFVLTPEKDVIELPVGATPIDFAYAVHTNIGNRAVGAIVNGKALGFDYKLHSGEVCQILTSKDAGHAKLDWLKFVVTRLARHEILKANGGKR